MARVDSARGACSLHACAPTEERTSHREGGESKEAAPDLSYPIQVFAAAGAPLGRAWDGIGSLPELVRSAQGRSSRWASRGAAFPPPHLAHLAHPACAAIVAADAEARGDVCNATRPVPLVPTTAHLPRAEHRIALPSSRGVRHVPWLPRLRLREGELLLWPSLVVEQAEECWSYLPSVRQALDALYRYVP